MHSIAMRRTKDMLVNGRPLVVLPKKTVQIVKVALDKEDRVKYDRRVLAPSGPCSVQRGAKKAHNVEATKFRSARPAYAERLHLPC